MAGMRTEQVFRPGETYSVESLRVTGAASHPQDVVGLSALETAIAAVRTNTTIIVRVASAAEVDLSSMPANVDGVALSNGDKFLPFGQSDATEGGPWVFNGAAVAATRDPNYDEDGELPAGALVAVQDGTYENKVFIIEGSGFLEPGVDNIVASLLSLDASVADGGITTAKLAADAVTGDKIGDDEIDSEHIASGAIDSDHLAAASVTFGKIADDAIDGAAIADGAIATDHIQGGAVTAIKLDSDSVTAAKIADGAVEPSHISSELGTIFAALVGVPSGGAVLTDGDDDACLVTYAGSANTVDVAAGSAIAANGTVVTTAGEVDVAVPQPAAGFAQWIWVTLDSTGTVVMLEGDESNNGGARPDDPALPAGSVLLAKLLVKDAAYGGDGVTDIDEDADIWDARRALRGVARSFALTPDDVASDFRLPRRLARVDGFALVTDNGVPKIRVYSTPGSVDEFQVVADDDGDGDIIRFNAALSSADDFVVHYIG